MLVSASEITHAEYDQEYLFIVIRNAVSSAKIPSDSVHVETGRRRLIRIDRPVNQLVGYL